MLIMEPESERGVSKRALDRVERIPEIDSAVSAEQPVHRPKYFRTAQ